jgi:hypothetical protein
VRSACRPRISSPSEEGKSVTLDVRNNTDSDKSLIWIDFDGKREPYAKIGPKQSVKQDTYVGHVWMIANGAGQCEKIFVPRDEKDTRVDIP